MTLEWLDKLESNQRIPRYKLGALPLSYCPLVGLEGIEPTPTVCNTAVLPLYERPMVGEEGLEPTTSRSQSVRSSSELHSEKVMEVGNPHRNAFDTLNP